MLVTVFTMYIKRTISFDKFCLLIMFFHQLKKSMLNKLKQTYFAGLIKLTGYFDTEVNEVLTNLFHFPTWKTSL